VGLSPLFHVHGYGTALALPLLWALMRRDRAWLWFAVPAVVLAVPVLLWFSPSVGHQECPRLLGAGPCLDPGWLAVTLGRKSWLWFWFQNTGLLVPVALVAQFGRRLIPTGFGWWSLPIWLWFGAAQIWQFHQYAWDNTKFIVMWLLVMSLLAGATLAWVAARSFEGKVLAAALLVTFCLGGALDLERALDLPLNRQEIASPAGLAAASWVNAGTPATAVLAVAPTPTEPVMAFAGRRVLVGWEYPVAGLGLTDYIGKERDLRLILSGAGAAAEVAARDRVSYVVIGPEERGLAHSDADSYWAAHGRLVYGNSDYRVYAVR
jgi:hypothetical protein